MFELYIYLLELFMWQASIIRIYKQLQLFEEYQGRLAAVIGAEQAQSRVNQALVLITLGGNDFVNNYFLPGSIRRLQFTIPNYVRYVLSEYKKVLLVSTIYAF